MKIFRRCGDGLGMWRWLLLLLLSSSPLSAQSILVAYHSDSGNTAKMADAVAEGVRKVPGAKVVVKKIADVTAEDIEKASALVVGSPTHWSNLATPVKQFIDSWPDVVDKVGAAFATGGAASGGKEHVVTSIALAMLSHGMVVVGPVYKEGNFRFGAAGATAETGPNDPGINEKELNEARALGERVATYVMRK